MLPSYKLEERPNDYQIATGKMLTDFEKDGIVQIEKVVSFLKDSINAVKKNELSILKLIKTETAKSTS